MAEQQILNIRIQNKYDEEAAWVKSNPVLLSGEVAFSSDKSGLYKIGDGTNKWSDLKYAYGNSIIDLTVDGRVVAYKKADGTTGTFTTQDTNTTYDAVTSSKNGLMTPELFNKLDGIQEGANKYTLPTATDLVLGGVKIGNNITNSSGTIDISRENVIAALGYTPPTTNTTYGLATPTASGLIKIGYAANGRNYPVVLDSGGKAYVNVPWTDTNTTYTLSSFGVTATSDELNYVKGATSNIQTQLDDKASSSHTHTKSQVTDFPTALKNPAALTINGTVYDGSTAKTVNIGGDWDTLEGKPDLLNCMRMYGGTALDAKGTTADSNAQYNTITLSTASAGVKAFSRNFNDIPKGTYSFIIRLKISANTSNANVLKIQCGDASSPKTFYIKPNMFTAANKYQTFGFTVDHTELFFIADMSVGTALSGVTANIDYIAISPTFTAITNVA